MKRQSTKYYILTEDGKLINKRQEIAKLLMLLKERKKLQDEKIQETGRNDAVIV